MDYVEMTIRTKFPGCGGPVDEMHGSLTLEKGRK
jgi:hypothetical protein